MNRRDLMLLTLSAVILVAALFRVFSPPGTPTRQISVEGVEIKSQPIRSGEALVQESSWAAPDDVFIVGWAPHLGAPEARPELSLIAGGTSIFRAERGSIEGLKTVFMPAGTGYLVRKGEIVKLRLEMRNSGPDGESRGARALLYFHPVAWR